MKKLYWFLFVYDLNDSLAESSGSESESFKVKLKRDITLLVLLSYVFFIFNTLTPYFADAIAHTFWEKEHLAAEHSLYGKNHVQLEISRTAKQAEKSSTNVKSGSEDYFHVITAISFNFLAFHFVSYLYPSYRCYYPVSHTDPEYRPPRA